MATITQTVEETLTFTAKPPQKQMKLMLQPPAIAPEQKQTQTEQKVGLQQCPPDCEDCKRMISQLCPPECKECEKFKTCPPKNSKTIPFIFNAIGILIAILATYMIISTDSNLYLVFWIVYSVLRRMTTKSKPRVKTE